MRRTEVRSRGKEARTGQRMHAHPLSSRDIPCGAEHQVQENHKHGGVKASGLQMVEDGEPSPAPRAWGAQTALATALVKPGSAPTPRPLLVGQASWLQSQLSICSTELRTSCQERKRQKEVSRGSPRCRWSESVGVLRRNQGKEKPRPWLERTRAQPAGLAVGQLGAGHRAKPRNSGLGVWL